MLPLCYPDNFKSWIFTRVVNQYSWKYRGIVFKEIMAVRWEEYVDCASIDLSSSPGDSEAGWKDTREKELLDV